MRPGSVIIDLAAQTGGNCVYTEANKAVLSPNGVTIVGAAWLKKGERNTERPTALILQSLFQLGLQETNYASQMAAQSSEMLGSNFAALLEAPGFGDRSNARSYLVASASLLVTSASLVVTSALR